MRLLTNPMFVRLAATFLLFSTVLVVGVVVIRLLRRRLLADVRIPEGAEDAVPLHTYAVIQQLKQQKFALENEQRIQKQRAKTSEHITAGVVANLPWGVLFITPNGLVRHANTAARQLLGFRSPLGMSLGELFREASFPTESGTQMQLAEALRSAVSGDWRLEPIECCYLTPANLERTLKFTVIPVDLDAGEKLGIALAFSDETALRELRESEVVRMEASAEMAFTVRRSLSSIREWAEQAARAASDRKRQDLATDIVAEAERLDQSLSRFLRGSTDRIAAEA